MGHGSLKEPFIVSSSLDELFVELREVILLLRVLADELDQLWSDGNGLVVQSLLKVSVLDCRES